MGSEKLKKEQTQKIFVTRIVDYNCSESNQRTQTTQINEVSRSSYMVSAKKSIIDNTGAAKSE